MTPTQEMVMTLFTKETIDKVKEQFKNGKEIVSNESFDMSFRLFKPTANYINLELLIQMPIETGEEQDFPGIGRGRMQTTVMFFKPVGFFTQKKGFLSTDIEVGAESEARRQDRRRLGGADAGSAGRRCSRSSACCCPSARSVRAKRGCSAGKSCASSYQSSSIQLCWYG